MAENNRNEIVLPTPTGRPMTLGRRQPRARRPSITEDLERQRIEQILHEEAIVRSNYERELEKHVWEMATQQTDSELPLGTADPNYARALVQNLVDIRHWAGLDPLLSHSRIVPRPRAPLLVAEASFAGLETVTIGDEQQECVICHLNMTGTALRLPCGHKYHDACIRRWLHLKDTCPMCRRKLPAASIGASSSSSSRPTPEPS